MIENGIMSATVHFIAGKGGVGKSLVASALAQFFANEGFKTLHVQLCEEESSTGMHISPVERVCNNLYYLKLFPDHAAYQYLYLKIHNKKILNTLLKTRLFRALCSAMPGLSDLTRLGKIWFHADERHGAKKDEVFQKIVVDMPSSGFVKRFLSVSRVVFEAVKVGPLAKDALLVQRYFADANHALLHLVAAPEELIVNETQELYEEMRQASDVALGLLFINRYPAHREIALKELYNKMQGDEKPALALMTFLLNRARSQEIELKKLEGLGLKTVKITEQWGGLSLPAALNDIEYALGKNI